MELKIVKVGSCHSGFLSNYGVTVVVGSCLLNNLMYVVH